MEKTENSILMFIYHLHCFVLKSARIWEDWFVLMTKSNLHSFSNKLIPYRRGFVIYISFTTQLKRSHHATTSFSPSSKKRTTVSAILPLNSAKQLGQPSPLVLPSTTIGLRLPPSQTHSISATCHQIKRTSILETESISQVSLDRSREEDLKGSRERQKWKDNRWSLSRRPEH